MNELTRISDMLKDARNLEERWKIMAQEQEDECNNLKYLYSSSDRTIRELQENLSASHQSLSASKNAQRRSDHLYMKEKEAAKEMRLRIIKLEAQLRDMGSALDNTTEKVLRMKDASGAGTSSDERLKRTMPRGGKGLDGGDSQEL